MEKLSAQLNKQETKACSETVSYAPHNMSTSEKSKNFVFV